MKTIRISLSLVIIIFCTSLFAQKNAYSFTNTKEIASTTPKNQGYTGTCWSFAVSSLLESELLSKGIKDIDLSEMYFVRCTYIEKAQIYIRLHGESNFGEGGEAHDVINIVKKYGMVPQSAYSGKKEGDKILDHSMLEKKLDMFLDSLISVSKDYLNPDWKKPYEKILDNYLGKVPVTFEYSGKTYTPKSFANEYAGINPDDYIEFTSYTHHPFYEWFFLEIPDNWSFQQYYNVEINDLIEIIDTSLNLGYSLGWGGDVSEEEFSSTKGIAIVPENDWNHKSDKEKNRTLDVVEKEKNITPEMRQKTFDNYTTGDDHFMHITGTSKDQNGTKFYYTKNSWGEKSTYKGYLYLSESYVKLKTISIIVNKNALPKTIKDKLGIK